MTVRRTIEPPSPESTAAPEKPSARPEKERFESEPSQEISTKPAVSPPAAPEKPIARPEKERFESEPSQEITAKPVAPPPAASGKLSRLEASVSELLEDTSLDEFTSLKTDPDLLVPIGDVNREKQASFKRAEKLQELDISSRDQLISLYIAEGKSESVAKMLSDQLSKEPENLNLSLSLSKLYRQQGDIKAALNVLNASLNRISLSARIALKKELITSVRGGKSTLTMKSDEAYLADEFSQLGISLLKKKKHVEALSAFQSLYSLAPDHLMVKYHLGLSRYWMKQHNQARQLLVEQGAAELKKQQLMDNLAALTLMLTVTQDIPTIKDTRDRYIALQQRGGNPREGQIIAKQIASLDSLLAEAEKRRQEGLPDLGIALSDDFSREEFQPGQKISFTLVTTNHGKKQSDPFRVYYQLKHAQGLIFDIPSFDRFEALKPDMAKHSWKKEILIPEGVVPGKYQLIANIELTGGKGEVTFDNNRAQSAHEIAVTLLVPDLKIEFTQKLPSMSIETGQKIDLGVVVTNIGSKDSPPFEIDYFLESETGEVINLKTPDRQGSVQKGNERQTWKKQLPIAMKLKEGQYRIVAKIRLPKKTVEENRQNNSVATGFNLNYIPPFTDLSLSFETEPPETKTKSGQSFSVQLKVENRGNSPSTAGKIVYQLLDEDGDEITLKDERRFPVLKKGQAPLVINQDFKLPSNLHKGAYRLSAKLALDNDDLERNEKNNQTISDNRLIVEPPVIEILTSSEPIDYQPPEEISIMSSIKKDFGWHIGVVSSLLLFTHLSIDNKQRYETLETENKSLKREYENAILQLDMKNIREMIADNESEMDEKYNTSNVLTSLILISMAVESYLLFFPHSTPEPKVDKNIKPGPNNIFFIIPNTSLKDIKVVFELKW